MRVLVLGKQGFSNLDNYTHQHLRHDLWGVHLVPVAPCC